MLSTNKTQPESPKNENLASKKKTKSPTQKIFYACKMFFAAFCNFVFPTTIPGGPSDGE